MASPLVSDCLFFGLLPQHGGELECHGDSAVASAQSTVPFRHCFPHVICEGGDDAGEGTVHSGSHCYVGIYCQKPILDLCILTINGTHCDTYRIGKSRY